MCHSDNGLNEPGGSLVLTGVPERYEPGATYPIVVALAREGLRVGGFQMAARFADGKAAGTWSVTGERARVASGGFVQHTKKGAEAESEGSNRWEVSWTAPERGQSSSEVVFNAAGNASNDDASALGDYIYTVEWKSAAR
jgi:hypothetical protein